MVYDYIVIGAGIYGMYFASEMALKKPESKILILENDSEAFARATYINQARVHMGYHYPRSYSTANKSHYYFQRFVDDFGFSIKKDFDKIYSISNDFSWTNAEQFEKFCKDSNIPCSKVDASKYYNTNVCNSAFLTKEYTFDAMEIKKHYLDFIAKHPNITILYNTNIDTIIKKEPYYELATNHGIFESPFVLNATYASINQILEKAGFELFKIKYEICEVILCEVDDALKDVGLTMMDGPFFSIMPFGLTNLHSLTSVTFTPQITCYDYLPKFECQKRSNGTCSEKQLGNCNTCIAKPKSAWPYMSNLARKYMNKELGFRYHSSLFSIKPILQKSEIDDSRPTVIKKFSENPTFISVLSGKINTIYDLKEVIDRE